jgi:hypothetical protein
LVSEALQIFERTERVKAGISFILSHFEGRQPLFPRKMSTSLSNGRQFIVYNQKQILNECVKADFIDCRINAYPVQMDSGLLQAPNIVFIDIDLIPFNKDCQMDLKKPNKVLNKVLKNIESRLDGFKPTVLWTGNGYHVYITVDTRPLELIIELNQLTKNPSEQFLKFSEIELGANKNDPNHNPSFKSCMLRIPYTLNSKCVHIQDPEVKIVQRFDANAIPKLNAALLREYRLYLADLDLKEKLKSLKLRSVQNFEYKNGYSNNICKNISREYDWIENYLLRTPIPDHRKYSIDLLLAPFLISIKKCNHDESLSIMKDWVLSCNDMMILCPNIKYFEERASSAVKSSIMNKIPPIKRENMQKKYPDWYCDFKSWKLF